MTKFESRTSPGHRLIVAALLRYLRQAPNTIFVRWVPAEEMLKTQRRNEAAGFIQ
jgi:hypothetical protein